MKKEIFINKRIPILIILVSLFMSIGYAAINSIIMDINGTVAASTQDGIYITDVKYDNDINADIDKSKIIRAYQTMLNSNIVLSNTDADSAITYVISMYNSTKETYYFDKVDYLIDDTTYSNEDITFKLTDLSHATAIESGKSLTFKITFYYKDGILSTDNALVSYLNFVFKKAYNIEYINILSNDLTNNVLDGDSVVVDLNKKAPSNIKVYINNIIIDDYTYDDYVLTISNVTGDVRAMFVWIPRYEYKISIDGSKEILINFIKKETITASDGYIIHPAFTFGDYQLDGIWVGKFETSTSKDSVCYTSPSLSNCASDIETYILPNVKSLREQTISVQFNSARNFEQYLTDNYLNSHMMKNSEWGAVAYLSQSKYGKYGNENYNGSNKEIYLNNSAELYTGISSGSYINQNTSFHYDYGFKNGILISEMNGTGASTTGNITGIYDMSGGSYEYVMGYLSTASSIFGSTASYDYAGFTSIPDLKYYDNYTSSISSIACNGNICYGHALDETSGWYDDSAVFITSDNPWVMRGGVFDGGASSGIFAYNGTIGYSGGYASFRIVLTWEN